MSGILTGPYFQSYFQHPTAFEVATMVSILEIGAFIGSLLVGTVGDIFGRKKTIFWGGMIFAVGGGFQTLCNGFPVMVFGRVISGFGVGFLSYVSASHLTFQFG